MRVVRLELINLVREPRLVLALVIVAVVFTASGIAGLVSSEHACASRSAIAARERSRWLEQGERDPHSAAHQSIYAFKPVLPLAAIEPGIEPFVGEAVWLEAHVQNALLNRPMQASTISGRLGRIDPAGLFVRLAPLMVFLLAVAIAAREREQGTLALTLSLARSGRVAAASKALAIGLLATAALVGPVAVTGLASLVLGGTDGDAILRLAGWIGSALCYVALLSMAAVAVALRARSQAAAFGQLLIVWVVVGLVAPLAASAAAARLSPLPSFEAMKIALERDVPAYWTAEVGAERRAHLLRRFGVRGEGELGDRGLNLRGLELDYAERLAQAAFDREIGGYYQKVAAQDHVYASLGWLSPAAAFDAISPALAGTDFAHHLRFVEAAERYRRALVNRMNADLISNPAVNGIVHTNDRRLWSQVEEFSYPLPGWRETKRNIASSLTALTAWLICVAASFVWTTSRLRP
jgi:ABC-2 type transport system permease protein